MEKLPYTAMIGYQYYNEQNDFESLQQFKNWCTNHVGYFNWAVLINAKTGEVIYTFV